MNAYIVEVFRRLLEFKSAADKLCSAFESAYKCPIRQDLAAWDHKSKETLSAAEEQNLALRLERAQELFLKLRELVPGPDEPPFAKVESELMHWIGNNVRKQRFSSAFLNVGELVTGHIPAMESWLVNRLKSAEHIDPALAAATDPLLATREWDSAIRKAIVFLSEWLRARYNVAGDGHNLISAIFSTQPQRVDPSLVPEGLTLLLRGFYALPRNRHAHHQREVGFRETQAIIAFVNWVLSEMEAIPPLQESS